MWAMKKKKKEKNPFPGNSDELWILSGQKDNKGKPAMLSRGTTRMELTKPQSFLRAVHHEEKTTSHKRQIPPQGNEIHWVMVGRRHPACKI